jgi:hypothetical protein
MEKLIEAKEVLSRGWSAGRSCCRQLACLTGLQVIGLLTVSVLLISCTTLKKAGVTSLATGAAVTVATALSSGATVPILAGMTTAFAASAVTDLTIGATGNKVMNECAADNFWSLLGQIAEMGGWFLILIVLVPMVLGWFLPGPTKLNRKKE